MSALDEIVTATHFVTGTPVEVIKGGPADRYWTALHGRTTDGVQGTLHDDNPMEYYTPRVWTFVPFGLPASAYIINRDAKITEPTTAGSP